MELGDKYKIDGCTEEEIREEIRRLAGTFTPEWSFGVHNPDAGSVIAMIFAGQTAGTIKRCNLAPEKFRTEFANLFGLSPRPAQPAHAVAVLQTSEDAPHGVEIKKGARFLADGEEDTENPVVFTTRHDIYATHAKLTSLWMISQAAAKYMPVAGYPFRLFDRGRPGADTNALALYHSFGITGQRAVLCLRMEGTYSPEQFAKELADPEKYRISYETRQGISPVENVWQEGDHLCLQCIGMREMAGQEEAGEGDELEGEEQGALVLERIIPLYENIRAEKIELYPKGAMRPPSFIHDGNLDRRVEKAMIFGQELSLYQSCYLGQEEVFGKKGARITFSFQLSLEKNMVYAQLPREQEKLPVIRRKERVPYQPVTANVTVQELSVCYFNGKGWRTLECERDMTALFADSDSEGRYQITFQCPADWEPAAVGSYEQRCLRLQIVRADNCYLRPACHWYPVLSEISFSYEYEQGKGLVPEKLVQRQGLSARDITRELSMDKAAVIFHAFPEEGESLLLGLDRKPEQGPVSFYFILEDHVAHPRMEVWFEYSSPQGFKPLKVVDNTEGFTTSGTVGWMPPEDMAQRAVAEETRYWIRIRAKNTPQEKSYLPVIRQICLNAVEMWNVDIQEEQEFYLDRVAANMSYGLNGTNILSADVWVNEKDQLTRSQMQEMMTDKEWETEAEYDLYGEIKAFYVKWQEAENFESSGILDRHYLLDRMENRILFGDGVKVRIPRMLQDTAFRVVLYTCSGKDGNVRAQAIHTPYRNRLFLERIGNPLPAAGGSNLEEQEWVLRRAGNLFGSRGRLVTEQDYVREALDFSDTVGKVKCIPGRKITGEKDRRCISLVVLMKDYEEGSMAFSRIKESLKTHLLSRCEISCTPGEIQIVEPIFVRVSVDLWVEVDRMEHVIEIREAVCQQIHDFLEPLTGLYGTGWEIGRLPGEKQIRMMLNAIRTGVRIMHHVVTLSYVDHTGKHETDLSSQGGMPFGICMNGEHHVHMADGQERRSHASQQEFG